MLLVDETRRDQTRLFFFLETLTRVNFQGFSMNSLQGKVNIPLERHRLKSDLKARRRRRYLKNQPSKSYRICSWCKRKIAPGQWGSRVRDGFYHRGCLFKMLRQTHTDQEIESLKGSNYGVIFTHILKSGF